MLMILMVFLRLVMMMTIGVAGKTNLMESVDGDLPSNSNGAVSPLPKTLTLLLNFEAGPHHSAMNHPLEKGIITISVFNELFTDFSCEGGYVLQLSQEIATAKTFCH